LTDLDNAKNLRSGKKLPFSLSGGREDSLSEGAKIDGAWIRFRSITFFPQRDPGQRVLTALKPLGSPYDLSRSQIPREPQGNKRIILARQAANFPALRTCIQVITPPIFEFSHTFFLVGWQQGQKKLLLPPTRSRAIFFPHPLQAWPIRP
jgi:hypothetical protein